MSVTWSLRPEPGPGTEAVVRPVWAGEPPPGLSTAFLAGTGFGGEVGQVLQLPGTPVTVLLGVGPRAARTDGDATRDAIRAAAAELARAVRAYRRLAVHPPGPDLRPLVEGYLLGGYRFTRYLSDASPSPDQLVELLVAETPDTARGLSEGRRLGEAVLLARDLVNEPGEALTPSAFADRSVAVAAATGLECEVWDGRRIADERLGGLLGVSRGSLVPPRLVKLSYRPEHRSDETERIALVGKGVTFDAGGLSLKPNAHLTGMKADMAGAAAVLGAMSVLGALDCRVAVDAWLPLTENMPNADPIRIGDVLVMRNGTTVEICHADAEGRLIMADALVLAGETGPHAIIDIATLTDAAAVALGRRVAALMGTDDALLDRLRAAGTRAGEPLWPLPLPDAYRPQLRSRVADMVNYTLGTRHGTALLAGHFLREFVPPGIPWAHLDIQGTALSDGTDAERVPGATGFGVRALAEFLTGPRRPPA
ncbi:leucyl aminopeptidase [Streptomyces sp. TLI_053]|uniref:leucyl aminopeptidase n=1 Tax=Streptomyces sp. TLI_053 TaxID=1855352 RepID=UPI00087D0360|nr:leucyl aminopeptidase [Streptomyces sp. TLI_053]SDT83181.1 leucyl aminopeptidase [Streptomyces sp. TLI_053]